MANITLEQMKDPKFYLETFCKIKGKNPGLISMKLNEAQKDLFNTLRKSNRVIITKARQIGFSTAVTGFIYHKAITTPGFNAALVGYNSDLVAELLDKVKTFWSSTPKQYRPKIKYNSKYEISFPVVDSKIMVLPSTENLGRGYSIHACLLTELAFWERADEKMTAIENSVPIDGLIVVESTPNGIGNQFHRMYMTKDNGYVKKDYGWWWHYSKEEMDIIKKRMNNPMKFSQEYELIFLSSGRSVFDPNILKNQRKNILKVGDKYKGWTVINEDELRIYTPPTLDGIYVAGVDTSEGVDGGDFSVVTIWDRKNGEEVACYRGLKAPDLLGQYLNRWGRKYNNALMVVEVNNHGLTTLTILKQLLYPSLYFRPKQFDQMGQLWSDRLGWRTTTITRPLMLDDLAQGLRDGMLMLHSQELIDEMMMMIYDKSNRATASEGSHDDAVMSAAIAFQGFKVMYDRPLDQVDYQKYLPVECNY